MRPCDGLLQVLSSSTHLPSGLSTLRLHRISLRPNQLRQFAGLFPKVKSVELDQCILTPDCLIECVEGFSKITNVVVVLRKDLGGAALKQFCEGALAACTAMEALRAGNGHQLVLEFRDRSIMASHFLTLKRYQGMWQQHMAGASPRVKLEVSNWTSGLP